MVYLWWHIFFAAKIISIYVSGHGLDFRVEQIYNSVWISSPNDHKIYVSDKKKKIIKMNFPHFAWSTTSKNDKEGQTTKM